VKALAEWANTDEMRWRRAIRAAVSAAEQSDAASKRRAIHEWERRAFHQVAAIYRAFVARALQHHGPPRETIGASSHGDTTASGPGGDDALANIITIRSPAKAQAACRRLEAWASVDRDRRRKAIRAATLAAHRAEISTHRRSHPLGTAEKKQMEQVAQIYRGFVTSFSDKHP
jgi:hypothetical protein